MVVQLPRATTEGQRSQGGASRSLGGRDNNSSLANSNRRWIPPSSLRRDALTQDNQHDVTFRKIRGLLNKLTPETFDKLSNELLNVGLNARAVLGGLILLIFQKALDEPKYCSMYAQLCKRLSEEAPNFDNPNSPCTFNRLLLKQCQEEFERRRNTKESWGGENGTLSQEDEEQRQISRRKMVGNLRFIGELGKLQIIQKSILYGCIEELLEKTRRSSGDLADDLECLCQIMRTCGRILDIPEAQNLMEQYFTRIRRLSQSQELNLRIRFMLQDLLDLREAGWRPRKMAQMDGPRTITEVREQAAREIGIYIPPPSAAQNYGANIMSPLSSMPTFFPQTGTSRTGMEDVFGLPMGGAASLGTGPGVISSQPDKFNPYDSSNGFGVPMNVGGPGRGDGSYSGGRNNRQQGGYNPSNNSFYQNKHFTNSFNRQQNNNHQQGSSGSGGGYNNNSGKDLPPRFKKMFVSSGGGGGGGPLLAPGGGSGGNPSMGGDHGELSLRPSANMSLKPKTPGLLPQSALSSSSAPKNNNSGDKSEHRPNMAPHYVSVQPPNQKPSSMVPMMHKDPPLPIKQIPVEKSNKNKKDKGPTRDEYMKRVRGLVDIVLKPSEKEVNGATNGTTNEHKVETAALAYKEIKLPERLSSDAGHALFATVLKQEESGREKGSQLIIRLRNDNYITHDKLWDGLKQVLSEVEASVSDYPRGRGQLAEVLAHLVKANTFSLSELAEPMQAGAHFPLYLLILQHLHKLLGKQLLNQKFNESKVNLLNLVPESERTKEQLSDLLEDRQLSFLFPLLRIHAELSASLSKDPTPQAFFKHIKDTLDSKHQAAPAFINALVTVVLKHITSETTMPRGTDVTVNPDKAVTEKEKEMLTKYKPVLQAFLHDHSNLQVIAVYALQVFTYTNHFPKGMLLRWFIYLYDLEIVEEDAFLTWKEDVNDDYPGKGKALFQVNQWLTWLQETEEEEEEDYEDGD